MEPLLRDLVEPFDRMPRAEASTLLETLYGLRATELEPLDSERDDSFRVTAGGRQFALKIAHPGDDPAVIDFQLGAIAHAAAVDPTLPLPEVIAGLDGHPRQAWNGRSVRLLSWLPGTLAVGGEPSPSQLHASGAVLGRLSLALSDYTHPAQGRAIAWDLQHLSALRELATDATAGVIDRFEASVLSALSHLPHQVIHNDFHPGNLLVDATNPAYIVGVLDFGDLVYSARVCDLGVALAYLAPQGDLLAGVQPFIDGYETIVPLLPEEKALLPDLVSGRLVQRMLLSALLGREARETRGTDAGAE